MKNIFLQEGTLLVKEINKSNANGILTKYPILKETFDENLIYFGYGVVIKHPKGFNEGAIVLFRPIYPHIKHQNDRYTIIKDSEILAILQ